MMVAEPDAVLALDSVAVPELVSDVVLAWALAELVVGRFRHKASARYDLRMLPQNHSTKNN